jgi:hypothetical protein
VGLVSLCAGQQKNILNGMSKLIFLFQLLFKVYVYKNKIYLLLFVMGLIATILLINFNFEPILGCFSPLIYGNWILLLSYKFDQNSNINLFCKIFDIRDNYRVYIKFFVFYVLILCQFLLFYSDLGEYKLLLLLLITLVIQLYLFNNIGFFNIRIWVFNLFVVPVFLIFFMIISFMSVHLPIALIFLNLTYILYFEYLQSKIENDKNYEK